MRGREKDGSMACFFKKRAGLRKDFMRKGVYRKTPVAFASGKRLCFREKGGEKGGYIHKDLCRARNVWGFSKPGKSAKGGRCSGKREKKTFT